jgi:hypothetical protein
MSRINNLYDQRVYLNNVEFDSINIINLTTNTTQMKYVSESPSITSHQIRIIVEINK